MAFARHTRFIALFIPATRSARVLCLQKLIKRSKYLRPPTSHNLIRAFRFLSELQRSPGSLLKTVMEKDQSIDTDVDVSSADEGAPVENKTASRSKKNQGKVPRKITKARREKFKREQLNDLFLDLAKALDIKEPNNGKASILTEAARFLNGMLVHVDRLQKENTTLTTESQYITVEKDELKEDNSMLLSEVEKLRAEIDSKRLQTQPNLNAHPSHVPLPSQPAQLLSKDHLGFTLPDTDLPHLPFPHSFMVFQTPSTDHALDKQKPSVVMKPCPRYPDQTGAWQTRILEEQLRAGKTN